jgi:predicted Zn-dependent peptidase
MELVKLTNGLSVVLVPCEAESVAFGLFVNSGSRHERPEEAGISHFIEHMLFKGTPTRTALDISKSIEGRGGMFNA